MSSVTSPAAKTPGTFVAVDFGAVTMYPEGLISTCPLNIAVAGAWPMAMNTPSTASSLMAPVLTSRSFTPCTPFGSLASQNLVQRGIPHDFYLRVREQPFLQNLLGTERIPAVDDGDGAGEIGQEQRLLDRGISAANHGNVLALIEEAVAGRAGRHTVALEFLLARQPQPPGLGARADNDCPGAIGRAGIALQHKRALREVHRQDVVLNDFGARHAAPGPAFAP